MASRIKPNITCDILQLNHVFYIKVIKKEKSKNKRIHRVPLPPIAIDIFKQLSHLAAQHDEHAWFDAWSKRLIVVVKERKIGVSR